AVRRVDERRGNRADGTRDLDRIGERHRPDLRPADDAVGVDHEDRGLVTNTVAPSDVDVGRAQHRQGESVVGESEVTPWPRSTELEQPRAGDAAEAGHETIVGLDVLDA